jgi:predicted transposase YdaD
MEERRAHDGTQRRLFAHVEMLKMLVEGFIPPEIIAGLALDLDLAEQMTGKFISHGLAVRESDMLWKIPRRTTEAPLYICLLLELQSSIDVMMPLRIMQYVSFIYENLARSEGFALGPNTLPPVLPVVLYNGDSRWNATAQVRDLIAAGPDSGLSPYLPTLRFLLIDEGSIDPDQLDEIGTLLAQLFKLENLSKRASIQAQVEHIVAQLKTLLPQELKDDVARFVSALLKPHDIDISPDQLTHTENRTMLADAFDLLKKEAKEEGIKEGIKEGIEAGRLEERRALLGKLLGLKFGPSETRAAALAALSPEQLDLAAALILSADAEDALFVALTA